MKFCKKYEEYMQGQDQKKLPGVEFKKLKKILKKCRVDLQSHNGMVLHHHDISGTCPQHCAGYGTCIICNRSTSSIAS